MLLFNAAVIILIIWLVSRKYKTILTPVFLWGSLYALQTVVAPILYERLGLLDDCMDAVPFTFFVNSLYIMAIGVAYLSPWSPFASPLRLLLNISRPFTLEDSRSRLRLAIAFVVAQFPILFVVLMITSGAGLMWITNSREAYQAHRTGVGSIWVLCHGSLMLSFLLIVNRYGRTIKRVLVVTFIFSVLALFLGSKGMVLTYGVASLFYLNQRVHKLRTRTILLFCLCAVVLISGMQIIQGASSILDTFLYFDYFANSARLISRFSEFGFRHGQLFFSELWSYVPRGLYPNKPVIAGNVILDDFLFPGAAEQGGTPAFLVWTGNYADFGIPGVVLSGLVNGFIAKAFYEKFLVSRSLQSLVLFTEFCLLGVLPLTPIPEFWIWYMAQSAVLLLISSQPVYHGASTVKIAQSE
jgi:oligosaccharide repeat unit polymerase